MVFYCEACEGKGIFATQHVCRICNGTGFNLPPEPPPPPKHQDPTTVAMLRLIDMYRTAAHEARAEVERLRADIEEIWQWAKMVWGDSSDFPYCIQKAGQYYKPEAAQADE